MRVKEREEMEKVNYYYESPNNDKRQID